MMKIMHCAAWVPLGRGTKMLNRSSYRLAIMKWMMYLEPRRMAMSRAGGPPLV
jgi:hypothetical protein